MIQTSIFPSLIYRNFIRRINLWQSHATGFRMQKKIRADPIMLKNQKTLPLAQIAASSVFLTGCARPADITTHVRSRPVKLDFRSSYA